MAKATVISASKLKQSLSAKKKPQKVQLRNVLAQPFARYWPEIGADEALQLIDGIHNARLTDTTTADAASSSSVWKSDHCTIGLKAVLRSLQKPTSAAAAAPPQYDILLISADIRPKFIVEQVLVLALSGRPRKQQPPICLLVAGLRELLSSRLGISACMCVALQRIRTVPTFSAVAQQSAQLAQKHPPPERYHRPTTQTWRDNKATSSTADTSASAVDRAGHKRTAALAPIRFDEIYVKKPNTQPNQPTQQRAFIPAGTVFRSEPASSDNWSDYISLGASSASHSKIETKMSALELMKRKMNVPTKTKVGYIGLTVNRVQANPNKVKKVPPPSQQQQPLHRNQTATKNKR